MLVMELVRLTENPNAVILQVRDGLCRYNFLVPRASTLFRDGVPVRYDVRRDARQEGEGEGRAYAVPVYEDGRVGEPVALSEFGLPQ